MSKPTYGMKQAAQAVWGSDNMQRCYVANLILFHVGPEIAERDKRIAELESQLALKVQICQEHAERIASTGDCLTAAHKRIADLTSGCKLCDASTESLISQDGCINCERLGLQAENARLRAQLGEVKP